MKIFRSPIKRSKRHSSAGATIVEATVCLPVLLLLLLGLLDFSLYSWSSHLMSEAARAGARKAAVLVDFTNTTAVASLESSILSEINALSLLSNVSASVLAPHASTVGISEGLVGVSINAVYSWKFLGMFGFDQTQLNRTFKAYYEWSTAPAS